MQEECDTGGLPADLSNICLAGDIDEEYLAVLEATGRGKRAKKKGSDKSPAVKPLVDDSAEAEELSL